MDNITLKKNNNLTILATWGGNWTHNLKLLSAQSSCVLGMGIKASPLPRGFQNPLQRAPGSSCSRVPLSVLQSTPWTGRFCHPSFSLTADRWSSCRQPRRSRGSSPSNRGTVLGRNLLTFTPGDGQVPVHTQGTRTEHLWHNRDIMSEMGGKKEIWYTGRQLHQQVCGTGDLP